MKKNRIRLTESQLHKIIKESVKNVLNEVGDTPDGARRLADVDLRNFAKTGMPQTNGLNKVYNGSGNNQGEAYCDEQVRQVYDAISNLSDDECREILTDIAIKYMSGDFDAEECKDIINRILY